MAKTMPTGEKNRAVSTQNPCRLCSPFGASMVFCGIADCVPFIHGSQGCSTYIRRYLIGHFREPVDIACSNFSENTVIFGGEQNLRIGVRNVTEQYRPKVIGISTTCLAETIGDDVEGIVRCMELEAEGGDLPILVPVSTPSYKGSHYEGFHRAVKGVVEKLAVGGGAIDQVNVFPGLVSPEDLRHLREITQDFGLDAMLLPDYSESLDGGIWNEYERNIRRGTPPERIERAGRARATIEFGSTRSLATSAGDYLLRQFGTPLYELPIPIGVRFSDLLFERLRSLSGRATPERYCGQRARLIDSYADGHKYVFGKRAVLYGSQDFVISMAAFLAEIGMVPALCGNGEKKGSFRESLQEVLGESCTVDAVLEDVDFVEMEEAARELKIDIVIGDSNGYKLARKLNVPLVRVGLPIHDRIGAARVCHLGYRGTQELFDRIVNEFIRCKQESSPVGYTHM